MSVHQEIDHVTVDRHDGQKTSLNGLGEWGSDVVWDRQS